MKKIVLTLLLLLSISKYSYGQVNGSFNVGGDFDKFYPVTFYDGAWSQSVPNQLILGRSDVHTDSLWRGSLMAIIDFHVSNYGHGSNFANATIIPSNTIFVAGWSDGSANNTCRCLIIWLRGGGTTYHYQSNFAVNPTIYDGIQNSLPYNEVNGPSHSFRTTIEEYATINGTYQNRNAFFAANVGIGTIIPDEKLTVKGKIHTQEVRVDMSGPLVPDYVFAEDYKLKSLKEVEDYIKENEHLPEIPSAQEIEKNGLMLAEMNMKLLKKIEELTLYIIQMKNENVNAVEIQNEKIKALEDKLKNKNNE